MSGCDTISALYSIGKIKHLKLLQSSQTWRSNVLVFGNSSVSLPEVTDVGELFIQSLYSGGSTLSRGTEHLRHLQKSIFLLNTYRPQEEHDLFLPLLESSSPDQLMNSTENHTQPGTPWI
jgi:hypothetical protein